MDDLVFELVDRTGRKIGLMKKQQIHIMRRHPYMQKYAEEIKETLRKPDKLIEVLGGKAYYYRSYKNLKRPNRFILVIVKYLNGTGFVITSYLKEKV